MRRDDEVSYFAVIYNHLIKLIELSFAREEITIHTGSLWAMLKPYIDDDLERIWRMKQTGGQYKSMMWKVRAIMLTLYQIEALPSSNIDVDLRVFGEFEPSYEKDDKVTLAGELKFRDLMMRYYFLLTELCSEGYDLESMHYMADLGYYLCSPYLTWEDLDEWKEQIDYGQWSRWRWFTGKVTIISGILDREGMQFRRRAIDQMSVVQNKAKKMDSPYLQPDIE